MKQTEARTLYCHSQQSNQPLRNFTIGNLLFELESNNNANTSQFSRSSNSFYPSSSTSFSSGSPYQIGQEGASISEEDYYSALMKQKQQLQPVSCIQSNNKSNQIEATFLQERNSSLNFYEQQELAYELQIKKPQYSQAIERYFNLRNSLSSFNQLDQNSDSGLSTSNTPSSQQQQEVKENIFFQFCNQEITKLNDLNGKQQFFSYTVIQCLDDELTPYIYKMGFSESLISILGSSRNNFQQMLMRSGTYVPFHQDIRHRSNFSLLESFLLCHDRIHDKQNFHTYTETCQLETFERLFFNCVINKYVIPCVYGGSLLGFIVLDLYTIPGQVIKGLLSRRKQTNSLSLPLVFPEEYKQKTEQFLEKIKSFQC